jgi:thymidylate synthase (FAD)
MWCGNTPFEHNAFTFLVKAPIFVFREWHRHRVAWSYNEVSGRYSVLPPLFYIPPKHRPLINAGTSARPKFEPGTAEQYQLVKTSLEANAYDAYDRYTTMLENGIGNEVARMVLPVNTFTAMYATANARSIMHFLSLRTEHDDAAYPSHPMWEIAQAAETMEEFFKGQFPITHEAFVKNGRVAP